MYKHLALGIACLVLFGAVPVHAQTSDPFSSLTDLGASDVEVILSPTNPGPREVVAISLRSDSIDLNRATISWMVQGTRVRFGVGERTLNIQTRDYGQGISVVLNITSSGGDTFTKEFVVQPEDLTLVWEAVDSYVPPFYKGKKLPAKEAVIKVAAIPNFGIGSSFDTKQSSFIWERNDSKLPASSGWQRDSVLVKHNALRANETVGVTATNQAGTRSARRATDLKLYVPQMLMYTRDPETGIQNPYAVSRILTTKPVILSLEPFFMSKSSPTRTGLLAEWTLNREPLFTEGSRLSLLINTPEEKGIASFGVKITNPGYTLQQGTYETDIIFQ